MDEFVAFVSEQWVLFAALVFIVVMLSHSFISSWGIKNVGPSEAVAMMNRQDAVLLDVRTDEEYKSGHIANSVHVPVGLLSQRLGELSKHKSKPIVVLCRTGQRSATACSMLRKQGFGPIYRLAGGITAWQGANLPLAKGK
jgi:rhodanese-related sulfurtransferase